MPLLARDRVRHVGEPIALVIADSPHAAEDGAERVAVEYELIDAVTSIDAALADDAPGVHDEGNVLLDVAFHDDPSSTAASTPPSSSSTRRSLRAPDRRPDGGARVPGEWTPATCASHCGPRRRCRTSSARRSPGCWDPRAPPAGRRARRRRRLRPEVRRRARGGARVRRRAARRRAGQVGRGPPGDLASGFQGHEQRFHVKAGLRRDGRIVGVAADILCDVGAYSTHPFTCGVEPLMAATELLGPYAVRCYRAGSRRREQQGADGAVPGRLAPADGARDGAACCRRRR
jgi:carbon-monoxide dehydrogenase large subunit